VKAIDGSAYCSFPSRPQQVGKLIGQVSLAGPVHTIDCHPHDSVGR
jgi:hypothetical protein